MQRSRIAPLLAPLLFASSGGCAAEAAVNVAPPPAPPPPVAVREAPAKPLYPATARQPVTDTYRDVRVTDDYRWLEDWSDPKVKAWSESENAFARKWLDSAPAREAIHARVSELLSAPHPSWSGLVARKGSLFVLEDTPPKQHPSLVVFKSLTDRTTERILVDPNAIDATGGTAIGWFVPTPDGKKVAVSLAKGGAERGDVHVFDVATGKETSDGKDVVAQADGAGSGNCVAWKSDGSGFFYTRLAKGASAAEGDSQHLFFHKLGTPVDKDALAIAKDGPSIAQWEVRLGSDDRTLVARMEYGDGGEYDQWVLGPSGKWAEVATKADGVKSTDAGPDGALYLLSTQAAPRGKLLRTSLTTPSLARAETFLAEGDSVIESFVLQKSHVYLVERAGGPARIRMVPLVKGKPGTPVVIATPPVSDVTEADALPDDDVAFATESYTDAPAWYRIRGKDGSVTKTALFAEAPAGFSDLVVTREECVSKDGTKVPLSIVRSKSTPRDGSAPAFLTGYGGFGIPSTPAFRARNLVWLEQGGVFAEANMRGGGEFGEAWHAGGNLANKQNVFDDFYACAEHLVEAKYTTPSRLSIEGGSNGGLLMGAELTQHPEAWKAVVSRVGIYDMLRVERDANGAFNATEYGTVGDPKLFQALYAYSPYHHVKDGVAYPAVLFMTGANDPRVAPYHSRKMTARLQAATSSSAPILLRTSANTGHGMGSPLAAKVEETTDMYAFLFAELGVHYSAR